MNQRPKLVQVSIGFEPQPFEFASLEFQAEWMYRNLGPRAFELAHPHSLSQISHSKPMICIETKTVQTKTKSTQETGYREGQPHTL